jgi:hypothetical protein
VLIGVGPDADRRPKLFDLPSDGGGQSWTLIYSRGLLAIIDELATSLGGHVHTTCDADGSSFLRTFPLTEAEQSVDSATHGPLKQRRIALQPSEA